jgi:hypothetical protein
MQFRRKIIAQPRVEAEKGYALNPRNLPLQLTIRLRPGILT